MLRSAHQFLKSPAEKERRDPDQPRPKDAAADRDICKRSAAGVRNARNTWRAIRAQIRPCRCAGSDEEQKVQRVGRDRTAPSLDAPSLHLLPTRLLQGRPSPPQATPSRQHALVKMPRFLGAMIPAMKLTILVLIALITLGTSVSMARSHNTHHKPRYGAVITGPQYLSPEAAAMRNAQRSWPNRPLCDDGGYRIRPCDLGGDRR